jgi:polysaccharide export outer membrane protein
MSGMNLRAYIRGGLIFVRGFSPGFVGMLLALWLALLPYPGLGAAAAQSQASQAAPPASPPHPAQQDTSYRIGPGDVLEISVWNEPQASVPGVVVRPDGKISLPLLKDISVVGLTPMELQQVLIAKLDKLIRGADVTVVVREIHSKKVYLVGQIAKIGPMPLTSDSTTILQAIAEAGGLTPYAKKSKIYVLRIVNGARVKLPFNYDAVVKGEHLEQNITLLPDDIIVVP